MRVGEDSPGSNLRNSPIWYVTCPRFRSQASPNCSKLGSLSHSRTVVYHVSVKTATRSAWRMFDRRTSSSQSVAERRGTPSGCLSESQPYTGNGTYFLAGVDSEAAPRRPGDRDNNPEQAIPAGPYNNRTDSNRSLAGAVEAGDREHQAELLEHRRDGRAGVPSPR